MAKYGPKIYPSEEINTRGHWAQDFIWTALGSKGDTYEIKMVDGGFTCSCPAFRKCKHIKSVEEAFNGSQDS